MPAQLRRSRRLTTMGSRQNTPRQSSVSGKSALKRSSTSGPQLPSSSPLITKLRKLSSLELDSNVRSSPRISAVDKERTIKKQLLNKEMSLTRKSSSSEEASVKRVSPVMRSPKTPVRRVRVSVDHPEKQGSPSKRTRNTTGASTKTSKSVKGVPANLSKPLKHSKRSKSLSSVKSLVVVLDTPMVLKRFSAKRQLMTPDQSGSPSKSMKRRSSVDSRSSPKKSPSKSMKRHATIDSRNSPKKSPLKSMKRHATIDSPYSPKKSPLKSMKRHATIDSPYSPKKSPLKSMKRRASIDSRNSPKKSSSKSMKRHASKDAGNSAKKPPSKSRKRHASTDAGNSPKKSPTNSMKHHSPMESDNTAKKRLNSNSSPIDMSKSLQKDQPPVSVLSPRLNNKLETVSTPTPRAPIAEVASRQTPEFSTPKSVCSDMPVEVSDYHVRRIFTRASNRANVKHTDLSNSAAAVKSQPKLLSVMAKHSLKHSELDNGAPMTRARRAALINKTEVPSVARPAATVQKPSCARILLGVVCRCLVALLMIVMVAALVVSGTATLCRMHYMPAALRGVCVPIRRWTALVARWTGRL